MDFIENALFGLYATHMDTLETIIDYTHQNYCETGELVISNLVYDELSKGDVQYIKQRLSEKIGETVY